MKILTGTVGEEFIIDGRIRIRILAVEGEEVRLEVNFPEFLQSDRHGIHEKPSKLRRWPAGSA
jgi:sRNA-binding carbon storage regulator CsrA